MLRRARVADSQFEIIGPQRIAVGRFAWFGLRILT
jgi:hypothetical protein